MIKKISSVLMVVSLAVTSAIAQTEKYIEWEKTPKVHKIPDSLKKYSAVYILDQRHTNYKEENDDIFVYRTFHRIIKLLDDKGIESFNKMSIPLSEGRTIERMQARTILPGGKIYTIAKDKIQTTKGENGQPEYLIAMEGIEKNAEVELLYTERRPFAAFGGEILQSVVPVMRSELTLISPANYRFEFRSFNGYPEIKDTLVDGKHFYTAVKNNIPSIEDEEYSNYYANIMRVDYKLSYADKLAVGLKLNTWNDLVKSLYNKYYDYTPKEEKLIRKYLSEMEVSDDDTEEEKITRIENYLKSNITISNELNDENGEYQKFDVIFAKKLTTESGFTRLMCACLYTAGVNYELGLTSDFTSRPVVADFEYWASLEYYVIYFPKEKKFLSPAASFLRYPMVPVNNLGNKGIFVKRTTYGNTTNAVSATHTIKPLPATESSNNIKDTISFVGEYLTPKVNFKHTFYGYTAYGLREAALYIPKEKEKELVKGLIFVAEKEEDIISYKIKYKSLKSYNQNKPLTFIGSANAPSLLEKAGNKYLFNIGDVIGRQSEMYNDDKRKMEIEIPYPHSLKRTIVFDIPKGYTLKNPEAVNSSVVNKDADGEPEIGFESSYKLEGNRMIVNINEYYNLAHYPISEYPIFRKVINAAADFNKVVLVFEKNTN